MNDNKKTLDQVQAVERKVIGTNPDGTPIYEEIVVQEEIFTDAKEPTPTA